MDVDVPAWLVPVLAFAGVAIGAALQYLASHRKTASEESHALIDQLQQELSTYRADAGRRATAQDERLNRLERNSDGYRNYAHELRAHIFDGLQPPPPEWPAGLPR